jgi:hypothetical protein
MKITLKFEPEFDFFLAKTHRAGQVDYCLNRQASVKDIIESFGIPHTEVGKITFDDHKIDFSYLPRASGVIQVFGIFVVKFLGAWLLTQAGGLIFLLLLFF